MKGRVSLFSSGKMISVGTTSEKEAFFELEHAMSFLVSKGVVKLVSLKPKIQNIVVTASFGESLNLEELCSKCNLIYEPEQFPGAILRVNNPYKATALLFASGKVVIAGLKSQDQIKMTLRNFAQIIGTVKNV